MMSGNGPDLGRQGWRSLGLAAFLFLVACDGDDNPTSAAVTAAQAEEPCRVACQHGADCGQEENVDRCVADCVDAVTGWVRHDALVAVNECSAEQSCDLDREQAAFACLTECEPLLVHDRFAAACPTAIGQCLGEAEVEQICGPSTCIMNPALVEDLVTCLELPSCGDRPGCLQAELDERGIEL